MVKMPLKWRKERGAYYEDRISQTKTYRNEVITKREKLRALYNKEPGGFDSVTPFKNASDIHLPLILDKIETAVPKVVSAMWRAEPFVNVRKPNGMADTNMAKHVETFASWAFRNDIPMFYEFFEGFNRNRFLDGTAFGKIRWVRKWRRTIETHTLAGTVQYEEDGPLEDKSSDEIFAEIFSIGDPDNSFYKATKKKGNQYEVKFIEAGLPFTATCYINPGEKMGELEVKVHRDIIESDSPVCENVDIEDLIFPSRTKSLQTADWVAHKTWYSIADLKRKKKKGLWQISDKDIAFAQGTKRQNDDEAIGELEKDRIVGESANTGKELSTGDGKVDPNKVLVYEVYTKEYLDDEDEPIDVILHILDNLGVVVGIEYHDEVFPHGRRPFIHDTYIPIDGRVFGIGMAEVLYGINLSLNKTINDVNNGMTLKTTPWFLYSIFGLAENAKLLDGIQPGEGIPVGDVNQVKFPDFMQDPAAQFHASFETLRGYADSLTFSPTVGGSNNYRNAPRTARGTLALMDAAEEKLSSLVEQSQATSWKEMVKQVISLYGRYVGIDKWYYVTGEPEPRRISPRELRENYQYEFSGSLTSVNRDIQRSLAERLYAVLSNDPLYQSDPRAKQNLMRRFAEPFSETGEIDSIIPALPGEGSFPHPPWQQETEMYQLLAGIYVEVLPVDEDESHLKYIESFKKAEMFKTANQRAIAMIDVHEQEHKRALQQKMQQQKQQSQQGMAGSGQPQVASAGNPAQGLAGYGGELSALEGGDV